MDEGLAALLGAIVGGSLSSGALWALEQRREQRHIKNLTIALGAEIAAVAELVRRRQWLEGLADLANEAKKGNVYRYTVTLPEEFLVVSRVAMKEAGLLRGRLPTIVPRVVMLADGISADFLRLSRYPVDHEDGFLFSNASSSAHDLYAELIGVLLDGLSTCDEIVTEVNRLYPKIRIPLVAISRTEQVMRGLHTPTQLDS